jgi:general secretion pathway protein M
MAIKITKREKYAIWVASGLIGTFVIIQLIITPLLNKRERLIKEIRFNTKLYSDIRIKEKEHEILKKQAGTATKIMQNRSKGFTLFSFLDQLAGQAGLKDKIDYMKPSTTASEDSPYKISVVETKLRAVTLQQLTTYIHMIETSNTMVSLKRLSISKKSKQTGYVDAVLLAETIEL